MIKRLLQQWPLIRQIQTGADGTGPEAMSQRTRHLLPKNQDAESTPSICPYCGVGCGQVVFHKDGELISIEGDPGSPISRGRLCPKGADTFELHTHSNRLLTVKHRRPFSTGWEDLDLESAMDMVADRVWETRERTCRSSTPAPTTFTATSRSTRPQPDYGATLRSASGAYLEVRHSRLPRRAEHHGRAEGDQWPRSCHRRPPGQFQETEGRWKHRLRMLDLLWRSSF